MVERPALVERAAVMTGPALTGPVAPRLPRLPFATRDVAAANAAWVCATLGLSLLPGSDHIVVVKQTRRHAITVHQTLYNWRLGKVPLRDLAVFDNGYCYTGRSAFFLALNQAQAWPDDDEGSHVPELWYRDLFGPPRPEHRYD